MPHFSHPPSSTLICGSHDNQDFQFPLSHVNNGSLPVFYTFFCKKKEGGNLQVGLGALQLCSAPGACVYWRGVPWHAATGNSEDAVERQLLPNLAAAVSYVSSVVVIVALLHLPLSPALSALITEVSKDSSLPCFWAENLFWCFLFQFQGYPWFTSPLAFLYKRPAH